MCEAGLILSLIRGAENREKKVTILSCFMRALISSTSIVGKYSIYVFSLPSFLRLKKQLPGTVAFMLRIV